jgi:hypothetical protein
MGSKCGLVFVAKCLVIIPRVHHGTRSWARNAGCGLMLVGKRRELIPRVQNRVCFQVGNPGCGRHSP